MSNVLFTADTHFDHANIIKLCNRPFADVDEMNEALVANWNAVVGQEDTVYFLGDFAFRSTPERAAGFAARLHGKVLFVEGNHEAALIQAYYENTLNSNWQRLDACAEIKVEGQRIILNHYALRTWNHAYKGVWHLYGHSHGMLPPLNKSIDVGVDVWGYAPVSFDILKGCMDARPIQEVV